MKMHSVTIGIPAHNEDNNIASLLSELVRQKSERVTIKTINVISDGSTDKTVQKAKRISDRRIKIFEYKRKAGPALRQDQLIDMTTDELLVLLNGDIEIDDPYFIEKLVTPIIDGKASLTSAAIYELPPRTFFESILYVSMLLKQILFDSISGGNNVYNCHGPARAFHKRLYQKLQFKINEGEDMYSYIICLKNKMKFVYARDAVIYYRLPGNFIDHLKQSVRYFGAQQSLDTLSRTSFAKKEFRISALSLMSAALKALPIILRYPLRTVLYLCIIAIVMICSFFNLKPKTTWNVLSSKLVRVKV